MTAKERGVVNDPWTAEDLIWWLRNGADRGGPFILPKDIQMADDELEVMPVLAAMFGLGRDRVVVFDPELSCMVCAPLDDSGEIIWEDWEIGPGR